jgi:hypothetical protein
MVLEGDEEGVGNTRFPVIGVSYPYRGSAFTVSMGSFLEQEWEVRNTLMLDLAGEEVEARDTFRSEGGIGQLRLGWGRRITESVAVGASGGILTGSLERSLTRELDPDQVGPDVDPFQTAARWSASGTVVSAGAAWNPSEMVRVGGSATWFGDLTLRPVAGSGGGTRSYSLPIEYRVGGTFEMAPRLSLVLGTTYADWTGAGEDLGGGGTRGAVWSYGGGIEWTGAALLGRPLPLRLGYRQRDLPFLFQGEAGSERGFSGGFGINLADTEEMPIARLELGVQRGSRDAGALSEDFWRATVSVRLAGG